MRPGPRPTLARWATVRLAVLAGLLSAATHAQTPASATAFPDLVARTRAAVVAVGTLQPLRSPAFAFRGTGFAVADGLTIVTNAHVLPAALDAERREAIGIAIPAADGTAQLREATIVRTNAETDLAMLRINGPPLPTLVLADAAFVRQGTGVALIGFPLGTALGLFPAVHRGTLSAVAPLAIPLQRAQQIDARAAQRLRDGAPRLYQLDATAFPGNSGSPLIDAESGSVLGVINQVVVLTGKEQVLPGPSGVSYAVPVRYVHQLLSNPP